LAGIDRRHHRADKWRGKSKRSSSRAQKGGLKEMLDRCTEVGKHMDSKYLGSIGSASNLIIKHRRGSKSQIQMHGDGQEET